MADPQLEQKMRVTFVFSIVPPRNIKNTGIMRTRLSRRRLASVVPHRPGDRDIFLQDADARPEGASTRLFTIAAVADDLPVAKKMQSQFFCEYAAITYVRTCSL
jgi:hypothetical protein